MSAKEVAASINSKVRTIENWAAAGNIRQDSQGKYGLISAFKYQLESLQTKLEKANEAKVELVQRLNENYGNARERKAIAEADKEEALAGIKQLELEKLQGKLIDAEEVEHGWIDLITNCVSKFQTVPSKLALQLSGMDIPEEIQQLLSEVINENLAELADSETIEAIAEAVDHTQE